jgi:hypothetical protein
MEAINIPENGILHSHRRGNLKTYIALTGGLCSGDVMCLLWSTNWVFISQKTFFIVTAVEIPSGGLHVKHTWNLGINSAFALGPRKTTENLDRVGRSQDFPDANWLLASSPALNTRTLTSVPGCAELKNVVFWDIRTQFVPYRRNVTSPLHSPAIYAMYDLRFSRRRLWRMPSSGI